MDGVWWRDRLEHGLLNADVHAPVVLAQSIPGTAIQYSRYTACIVYSPCTLHGPCMMHSCEVTDWSEASSEVEVAEPQS